jgi:hypothetical protein
MSDDTDYSRIPQSISELRAKRQDKAKLWTPRDALVNTLRRIDSGEIDPVSLALILETETEYHSVIATPDKDKTIALFYRGLEDATK